MEENNKNYYMEQSIGNSGVAETQNPYYAFESYKPFSVESQGTNVGQYFDNDSKYDEYLGNLDAVRRGETTIEDLRAESQTGLDMAVNAVANNLVIAGTTAISGTVGLVDGIFTALSEGNIEGMWNNTTTNWASRMQEKTREALPIHRGQDYQNKTIGQKLGTGIFWADLVQNLGFTEGMLLPGIGVSKLLAGAPKLVSMIAPSFISSIGEASVEAVHSKNDELNLKLNIANKEYNRLAAQATSPLQLSLLEDEYRKTVESINNDVVNAGNFIFGSNIALLTLSNSIQFGNLFSRGFGTAKRVKGALKRKGSKYYTNSTALELGLTGGKKVLDAFSEGAEEVSQAVISNTPGNFADYNTFNNSMFNPEKREVVSSAWRALGQSFSQTLKDPNTQVEFAMGFITGALGVPSVRKSKMPLTLENNIIGELYNTYKQVQEAQKQADEINARLQQDKDINTYYNGLVRHLAIQDRMNTALDKDDVYDYKTAESAQFISDIMMFDEAGDLQHLKDIISNTIDLSDQGIETIIQETTQDGEGPFTTNGNPMSKEDIRRTLQEKVDILNNKIDSYSKNKEFLQQRYPDMDTETINNALFLKEQFNDHNSRLNELLSNTATKLNEHRESLARIILSEEQQEGKKEKIKKGEGKYIIDPNTGKKRLIKKSDIEYYDWSDGTPQAVTKETNAEAREVKHITGQQLLYSLLLDPESKSRYNDLLDIESNSLQYDERQALKQNIEDIIKLHSSLQEINKQLKTVLSNPNKSKEDKAKNEQDAINNHSQKTNQDAKQRLSNASNLQQFRELLNAEDEIESKEQLIEQLITSGDQRAKDYKEVESYANSVRGLLNTHDDAEIMRMSLELFNKQYNAANNLQEIANPNSVYIDDPYSFLGEDLNDETLDKFYKAQYLVQQSLVKTNKDNAFKDRFTKDYIELKQKGNPDNNAPTKDTTGDSGTSTITPIKPNIPYPKTDKKPQEISTASLNDVVEENKQLNTAADAQELPSNGKYYKPSIPEIHIEASKEGDFRPFKDVVKEKEGKNFDKLYDYLFNAGAFSYINEGKLKVGDKLDLMIDPIFEKEMQETFSNENKESNNEYVYKGPTIFFVKGDQVVGSLDDAKASQFEGLFSLRQEVTKQYNTRTDKDSRFVYKVDLPVSKIMIGKIKYTNEERNLRDINNVLDATQPRYLAIGDNYGLNTNGKIDDSLILYPKEGVKKGRVYLLIPNGAGKYSPVSLRTKHFNAAEFNPSDIQVKESQIYKELNAATTAMASVQDEADLGEAVKLLSEVLFIRNLHINLVINDKGSYLQFIKVERDSTGKEVYENDKRKEIVKWVKFPSIELAEITETGTVYKEGPQDYTETINAIENILMEFNLPIQIEIDNINSTYNRKVVNSGVLTSNIEDATVIGNWFITDYVGSDGKVQKAVSPQTGNVDKKPRQGNETLPTINIQGKEYYVDLRNGNIYDSEMRQIEPQNKQLILDLAWADANFGNAVNGSLMFNNKVVIDDGSEIRVLDKTTQKYLQGKEAQDIIDKIKGVDRNKLDTVLTKIEKNQEKVDKSKTDSTYYYVLEEDGKYHKYERVHSRIGNQWKESLTKNEREALDSISINLQKTSNSAVQFNNYLTSLENSYNINLQEYRVTKGDIVPVANRDAIINIIKNTFTEGRPSLSVGNAVDTVIRQFFQGEELSKPKNMSQEAFEALTSSLSEVKDNMDKNGMRFLTNNIVLFHKYADGTRIAGEVDILAIDSFGGIHIYDVKTSKYTFHGPSSYFDKMSDRVVRTTKDQYTLQLSAYQNLFESEYKYPVSTLRIMPFVVNYGDDRVIQTILREKGITLQYNPEVNVPLEKAKQVQQSTTPKIAPVVTQPIIADIDHTSDNNYKLPNGVEGLYVLEDKIHKGYVASLVTISGKDIKYMRIPIQAGWKAENNRFVYDYYAVFPNGYTYKVGSNISSIQHDEMLNKMKDALSAKPDKVLQLSNTETPLTKIQKPANTIPANSTGGASASNQQVEASQRRTASRMGKPKLRQATEEFKVWNKAQELAWLYRVLPQLSQQDRIKFSEGLIKVAETGAVAWGQFDGSIMTLSNIAAEGTAYHEAFHVVFNLLLDNTERAALFNEAKSIYGNKSELDLEEDMAESFREFVMQGGKDRRSLGRKILDFFKSLLAKVTNWKIARPSMTYYFKQINDGKYATMDLNSTSTNRLREEEYSQEMKDILATAPRDEQSRLLAPNGKSSNLTERQYAQVRTKAFIDWFGDWINDPENASKVVDENGEPMVVYHHTDNPNLSEFNNNFSNYFSQIKGGTKHAIFFTTNPEKILNRKYTVPVFLNLKTPFTYNGTKESMHQAGTDYTTLVNNAESVQGAIFTNLDDNKLLNQTVLVAYNPNQIKSATDNIGTFSRESNNIYYRKVPTLKETYGIKVTSFNSYSTEIKNDLQLIGWTEDKFNSISQQERDQAVKCLGL